MNLLQLKNRVVQSSTDLLADVAELDRQIQVLNPRRNSTGPLINRVLSEAEAGTCDAYLSGLLVKGNQVRTALDKLSPSDKAALGLTDE